MPVYRGTGARTDTTGTTFYRGTGARTEDVIDHLWRGTGATTDELVWRMPNLPVIGTFTISPTSGTTATVNTIRASWTTTGATALEITEIVGSGTVITHAIGSTLFASGHTDIARPNEDTVFTLRATNADGTAHETRHFNLHTPLGSLSLVVTGYVPQQGLNQNLQTQPRISVMWTGDPWSAATLTASGYPQQTVTFSPSRVARLANDRIDAGTHQFTIPHGSAVQDVVFTLTVTGVTAQDQPVTLTTTNTIHVPARAGG